jgi:hypothetical protein
MTVHLDIDFDEPMLRYLERLVMQDRLGTFYQREQVMADLLILASLLEACSDELYTLSISSIDVRVRV